MIKHLISFLTALAGLIGFLLMGNTAVASPLDNNTVEPAASNTVTKIVNLNVSSPLLQLNSKTATSIFEHLGCSCAICTQGAVNLESDI
ncbi:MAG: hypothetical protein QNJ70_10120 [Xenococcaceae cyanobacterium MO_207.B15]|nr:hypothetical protein [Xenococcaceae cyanobacterium MO_207.B15]MDJ0745459.1 hypothetical protein [Xenococcaceae cyanobacterium MO_167.B27]